MLRRRLRYVSRSVQCPGGLILCFLLVWCDIFVYCDSDYVGIPTALPLTFVYMLTMISILVRRVDVCPLVLPTAFPADEDNMNFAIISVGGSILAVTLTWTVWERPRDGSADSST
ncbi:hypothetical protein PM082_009163 [Marasmius tenuissimus]|nr:hypothetical protein PM082_009163 [Marasmius tenuissimus]